MDTGKTVYGLIKTTNGICVQEGTIASESTQRLMINYGKYNSIYDTADIGRSLFFSRQQAEERKAELESPVPNYNFWEEKE